MFKNEFEIDVFRCVNAITKKRGFIALFTLLSFLIGLGLTLDVGSDQYTSVATVYAAANTSYSEATSAVTAMNAYLDVATSYKVCQRTALLMGRSDIDATAVQESLEVSQSAKQTSSSSIVSGLSVSSATIISFSATTTDPEISREMADAAAEAFSIEMASILKFDAIKSLDSASLGELSMNAQVEAWKKRIGVMLVGLILICAFIIALEVFDSKVRTIRDATIRNQLPVIGIIPDYKE